VCTSPTLPDKWSACSKRAIWKAKKHQRCLHNKPEPSAMFTTTCGNGHLETGEDCDCGTAEECEALGDLCCDAKTCFKRNGTECAQGHCCDTDTCRLKLSGSVCRRRSNECDKTDRCNGKSATCTADNYRPNGIPCHANKGVCSNGTCLSLDLQCQSLWEPGNS